MEKEDDNQGLENQCNDEPAGQAEARLRFDGVEGGFEEGWLGFLGGVVILGRRRRRRRLARESRRHDFF